MHETESLQRKFDISRISRFAVVDFFFWNSSSFFHKNSSAVKILCQHVRKNILFSWKTLWKIWNKLKQRYKVRTKLSSIMFSVAKPRVAAESLKCQSLNCDFYGNTQWDGFCSRCYREKVLKERLAQGKLWASCWANFIKKKNFSYHFQRVEQNWNQIRAYHSKNMTEVIKINSLEHPVMIRKRRKGTSWKFSRNRQHWRTRTILRNISKSTPIIEWLNLLQ